MVLFLAAAFLLQDKTAEETFRKIEEAIDKAKTISIRMKYKLILSSGKPGLDPAEMETKAEILLNDRNMVQVIVDPNAMFVGGGDDLSVLSDGTHLRVVDPSDEVRIGDSPKSLTNGFKTILARTGYFGAQLFVPRKDPLALARKEPDLKKFLEGDLKKKFEVLDLASGKDKDGEWLTYTLGTGEKGDKPQMTIWYSPKTYSLLKRKLAIPFVADGQMIEIETYDEFLLNADIPDEKFRLPAKK